MANKKIIGVIPARYASSRFPGKPLVSIKGKPMIQRVYEQASKAASLGEVIVATDDQRIVDAVNSFGGKVVMTAETHQSGTDRCAEVLAKLEAKPDVIINIQGDEPFIYPEQIDQLAACFNDPATEIATLAKAIDSLEELENPNVVKVVRDKNGFALYFSRSPIPHRRNAAFSENVFYKHVGIYGYKVDVLGKVSQLEQSNLEMMESLEQLRWLENTYRIKVAETAYESWAIDTPEDLEKLLANKIFG